MTADPVLQLAREWLLAQGARLAKTDSDTVAGKLPDGASVRYTGSPLRAREDLQTVLLAPGATGLETLLGDIERRGASPVLRVDAPPARPETLAREAFVVSTTADALMPIAGRFVVVGAGKGVREAVIERRWEMRTLEYSVRMSVASPSGRREELIRVALDATTGEPRRVLDETLLRQARAVPGESAGAHEANAMPRMLEVVERLLEPATRAAARLARAQALPEYQRRQDDIQALYARLLQESPEQGAALLGARERELRRLAEARAIELQLRVVNVATIISELARVRVHFAGGGEVTVDVDPCRAHVLDPRCPACDRAWRIGARCAEGHITCLDCQQVCDHCDKRRCPQCASVAFVACSTCGESACEACARSAVRGRHRSRHPDIQADQSPALAPRRTGDPSPRVEPASEHKDEPARREDLTLSDLDAMTDTTWRACLTWLLETWGYTLDRALDGSASRLALVCRRTALAPTTGGAGPARFGDILVVVAHRPDLPGEAPPPDLMREVLDLARQVPGAHGLLVTTAHMGKPAGHLRSAEQHTLTVADSVAVLDRGALADQLPAAASAYERERRTAEQQSERRGAAAQAIRTWLMQAASGAASALEQRLVADSGAMQRRERGSSAAGEDDTGSLEQAAMTARQALAALDTLVEEWEGCFAPAPSRNGALSIVTEEGTFGELGERAEHLSSALGDACEAVIHAIEGGDATVGAWQSAVIEELQLRCLALESRVGAIDPSAWRSFSAAHDAQAAQSAVEALAASGRAALRARRLLDELEARQRNTVSPQPGARTRLRR